MPRSESLSEAQSEARALSGQQRDSQRSYAAATCSGESITSSTFTHVSNPLTIPSNRDAAAARPNNHLDRKYNVIVYGVNECPKGTTKHARLESDLNGAVTVLSKLDNHIQKKSIKDVYRLGKFNPVAIHPRPLLVQFIRATDVVSVLSKKGSLSRPLFIKPDLSPQERQRDSILLKERWSLVQTGIPRHDIKIRGPCLYVKGKLFCHFSESQVIYSSGPSELLPIPASLPQLALSTKDNTSMPPNENESLSPVPVISIAVSKAPVETSSTDKNTSCATSVVQCNVSHTLAQSQSPSHSPLLPTDHLTVSFNIQHTVQSRQRSKSTYVFDYSKANFEGLCNHLLESDFSDCYILDNVEYVWTKIKQTILSAMHCTFLKSN